MFSNEIRISSPISLCGLWAISLYHGPSCELRADAHDLGNSGACYQAIQSGNGTILLHSIAIHVDAAIIIAILCLSGNIHCNTLLRRNISAIILQYY